MITSPEPMECLVDELIAALRNQPERWADASGDAPLRPALRRDLGEDEERDLERWTCRLRACRPDLADEEASVIVRGVVALGVGLAGGAEHLLRPAALNVLSLSGGSR